jgi:two-component system KDP operon response regulator KdpE
VEDEDDLRIDIAEFFQESGWRVETASCGRDALLRLHDTQIDIWLIDLGLPDMKGLELLNAINEQSHPPRTIVLTASLDSEDLVASLRLGCDNYLNKTAPLEAVLAAASNLLRHKLPHQAPRQEWFLRGRVLIHQQSGHGVRLTPSELSLLSLLGKRPNEVIERGSLLDALNRPNPSQSNLEVYISRLRRKLQDTFSHPPEIIAFYGTGYMIDSAIRH